MTLFSRAGPSGSDRTQPSYTLAERESKAASGAGDPGAGDPGAGDPGASEGAAAATGAE